MAHAKPNEEEKRIEARMTAAWAELGAAIEEWRGYLKPTDEEYDEASQLVMDQYADMKASEHAGSCDWDAQVLEAVEDLRKDKVVTGEEENNG